MPSPNLIRVGVEGDLQELSMFGRKYATGYVDGLTREERSADATLRRDVWGTKRWFLLSYDTADQIVIDRFKELFELHDELQIEITHLTDVKTYTVLMSPFEQERLLAVWGGMWEGSAMELLEV